MSLTGGGQVNDFTVNGSLGVDVVDASGVNAQTATFDNIDAIGVSAQHVVTTALDVNGNVGVTGNVDVTGNAGVTGELTAGFGLVVNGALLSATQGINVKEGLCLSDPTDTHEWCFDTSGNQLVLLYNGSAIQVWSP